MFAQPNIRLEGDGTSQAVVFSCIAITPDVHSIMSVEFI